MHPMSIRLSPIGGPDIYGRISKMLSMKSWLSTRVTLKLVCVYACIYPPGVYLSSCHSLTYSLILSLFIGWVKMCHGPEDYAKYSKLGATGLRSLLECLGDERGAFVMWARYKPTPPFIHFFFPFFI